MNAHWTRVIIHVDMDAFFAAVETLLNPELRGKPVIVGAAPQGGKGRGVVSTASYEARLFGVRSAMPISTAYRLCPHGIYITPQGGVYAQYSRQILQILEEFTPLIQKVSIDEAFLDVSGHPLLGKMSPTTAAVRALGLHIKQRIVSETGLTASLGISSSKSVAKIASDFQKPDGLTIVAPHQVQAFLDPLPVRRLWGVGEKTFQTLARLGIQTVQDLRGYSPELLEQKFGKMGPHLLRMAQGIDERPVSEREEIKSVSHETTFSLDQTNREIITSTLLSLAEQVSTRLRKYHLRGRTIQLKLRFSDFSTFTRNKTLPAPTCLTGEIYTVSRKLLEQFALNEKPVRLIGVGVSQLVREDDLQMSLWDAENQRQERLEKIRDQLQEKYGISALRHAQTLAAQKRKSRDPGTA